MQMKMPEMSPCRVPCHLGRMGSVDAAVVGAGGVVVEAGVAVAGAEDVAEEGELSRGGMSQTWC